MKLDPEFLDRRPEEGARLVALALCQQAEKAAGAVGGPDDAEALHDFRVALRRLRTTIEGYDDCFAGIGRRRRARRLKKLARATNPARDAQVELEWLSEHGPKLRARHQGAVEWLSERLEARRTKAEAAARAELVPRFRRLVGRLRGKLERFEGHLADDGPQPSFAQVMAGVARERMAQLRERMSALSGPGDEAPIHKARIEAKRLRYLLEPLRGHPGADAEGAVALLKELQDVLGELHDLHVLAGVLAESLRDSAVERSERLHAMVYADDGADEGLRAELRRNLRPGLLALDRLVRRERDALFDRLRRDWLAGGLDRLEDAVERLAGQLDGGAAGAEERAPPAPLEANSMPPA
ncbi:MAG TPA: CHAD domain-containing protein [Anaeromyxobacteraceae bacterium]|jgi:CHAD domain-containing protein|nr:CHAD domain-containing protein [Anaeromyxobacteraceae bacterium]